MKSLRLFIRGIVSFVICLGFLGCGDKNSASTGNPGTAGNPVTVAAPPPPPARTLTRTGYILTGGEPESIVYDKARKLLWVSLPDLGQVLVIDPSQRKVLNRISIPLAGTMDLSPDGTQIVVGSDTLPRLTFIDTASQSVTGTSLLTTALYDAGSLGLQPYVDAATDPTTNPMVSYPRFIAGGDVVFLGSGGLFRWSAGTTTIAPVKNGNYYAGTALYRTPDGTKVLITTTENELDVYDAATDTVSAHDQTYSRFAAADPVNPRFALFDSNGYDIVDVNLHQLGAVDPPDIVNNSGALPYASYFSADGTQLFVARSALFKGSYALETVDTVHYKLGSQAPLTNFYESRYLDAAIPQAIDSSNLIYSLAVGGIAVDDPLNYFTSSTIPRNIEVSNAAKPNYGPVAASTSTMFENLYSSSALQSLYFDGVPVTVSAAQTGSNITVTTPPIQTPGPVTVHAFTSDGSFSAYPAAFTYGAQAVALEPNAGPASGGTTSTLLAYGVSGGPSTISVAVGGVHATVSSVTLVGGGLPYLLPLYSVQFVMPPGTAGTSADVALTASGYTATLPHAFTYETATLNVSFPSSTTPNSIFFDAGRQQAYLLSPTRIDVFSIKSNSFLAPIIPPTKNGTLGLTGLDLSLDGKTLVVADMTDQTLALIDPDHPSSATLVPFAPNVMPNAPFGPRAVIANSKGTYFISPGDNALTGGGGSIWEFNPVTRAITQRTLPFGMDLELSGCRLVRSADGKIVLIQSPNGIPGTLGLWNAANDTFTYHKLPGYSFDAAISPDGSLQSAFVDPDLMGPLYQYAFDSSVNVVASMSDPDWLHTGWLWGQFFDPSGTLFYVPDNVGLDIYDVHTGHLQRKIGVKEAPNPTVYTAATSDTTGNTLLLLTKDGLDIINDVPPLAVRSVTPLPNSGSAGTVITIKGTNFVAGTTVTIGEDTIPTTITDSHTLSFSLPKVVPGNTLTLTNPDGSSYTY